MKTEHLKQEYNQLIADYGTNKVRSLFPSGVNGYIDSRTRGRYSLEATKQTLDMKK